MKSQTDRILALLRHRGDAGVTPLDALDELGCYRLAARIGELRAAGYDIETRAALTPKRVARYVLGPEQVLMWIDL